MSVTLLPIVLSSDTIYSLSRLRKPKQLTTDEFLEQFADTATVINVSFEQDQVSNPQAVTGYGFGLDCWYIEAE